MSNMRLASSSSIPAKAAVLCLAADEPAQRQLAAATSDKSIAIFDCTVLGGVPLRTLGETSAAHGDRINELTFATGPLVSASSDGTVKLWDAARASAAPISTLTSAKPGAGDESDEVWSVSTDAFMLAAGTESAVIIWDVRRCAIIFLEFLTHPVCSMPCL